MGEFILSVVPAWLWPSAWLPAALAAPLLLSLKIAFAAVIGAFPLALLIALYLGKPRAMRALVESVVYLPLLVPPTLVGLLLSLVLASDAAGGRMMQALLGGPTPFWIGAAMAAAVMALPLMVLPMALAFRRVDPGLIDAARVLGASRLGVLRRVVAPLAAPGIRAGLALGFARAFSEFGATLALVGLVEGPSDMTMAGEILRTLLQRNGLETPLLLAGICALIGVAAILVARRMEARR